MEGEIVREQAVQLNLVTLDLALVNEKKYII